MSSFRGRPHARRLLPPTLGPAAAGPSLALHDAAREGRLDDIQRLVAAGGAAVVINVRDPAGATPLHVAVDESQREAALVLLRLGAHPAIPDARGFAPLHLAVIRELPEVVLALLEVEGCDVNSKTFPPPRGMPMPQRAADDEEGSAAVEPTETTPLNIAVQMGQVEVVRALLQKGADPAVADGGGNDAVLLALEAGDPEVLRALLEGGASPGGAGTTTAAHLCAQQGKAELLRVVLEAKAPPDVRDANGFTPLHLAARMGRVDAVEALLAGGADPAAANNAGATPLHLAAVNRRTEAVAALLKLGAGKVDVGAKNNKGAPALQPRSAPWCSFLVCGDDLKRDDSTYLEELKSMGLSGLRCSFVVAVCRATQVRHRCNWQEATP